VQARVNSTRVELDAARLQQATGTPRRGADTSGMKCGVAERAVEHGIANFRAMIVLNIKINCIALTSAQACLTMMPQ
jgi:hypothetical protein